jgi:drug/metabolite transporter (DMT)-like permease
MTAANSGRSGLASLAIVLVAFIWGATFVVVKEALEDVTPFLFLAIRFSLAIVLLAGAMRGRLARRSAPHWGGAVLCGTLLFLGYALQTTGLRLTTASKSAFITGLFIVLVPLFGSIVYGSKPRPVELAGAAVALAGTGLMTSTGMELRWNSGDLLTAGCAAAFAAHILSVAHFSKKMDYERLSVMQVAGVAVWSWVAVAALETPRIVWSLRVWFAVLTTAALATALSFFLFTWAQQLLSATRVALLFALEPVFAGLTSWLVAGEAWTARSLTGAGLILAAIVLVELKPAEAGGHQLG